MEKKEEKLDEDEEDKKENAIEGTSSQKPESNALASLKFQSHLQSIIKTQEEILGLTVIAKEKFRTSNEISRDQVNTFNSNVLKYGKYLSLIKNELGQISDTLKKIKQLEKK